MASDLSKAHIAGQQRLRSIVAAAVTAIWHGLSGYDRENVDEWLTQVLPVVDAGQRQSVALTEAFLARSVGRDVFGVDPVPLTGAGARNGTPPESVYERSFITVWSALKQGVEWDEAVERGLLRATTTAQTDVQLAMRETLRAVGERDELILGFQRVPGPEACAFCRLVAGQRYTTDQLMPLHNLCDCGVDVITEANRGDFTGKRSNDLSVTRDGLAATVREHGELGPVLVNAKHRFTGPDDLADGGVGGGGNGGGGSDRPTGDDDLPSRLDRAFAGQRDGLTEDELRDVQVWQRTDRRYALVQAVTRGRRRLSDLGSGERGEIGRVIRTLTRAIDAGRTPEDLSVYRGIRNVANTFGTEDAESLIGTERVLAGFTAASIHREVAETEFTGPRGAIIELEVPEGTPALWVAGLGATRLRYQGELLFHESLPIRITAARRDGDRLVLSAQVIT